MAYTWGAGANDRVEIDPINGFIDPNSILLTAGWSYATSLVSQNRLWGTINAHYAKVDSVTSTLEVGFNRATTDYVRTYTNVFSTNVWQFIAILAATSSSTPVVNVWLGSLETAPVLLSAASTTSGSGSVTSASTMRIGNADSTAGYSWDGDLADYVYIYSSATRSDFFGVTPAQAQTSQVVDWIGRRFITPLWRGEYSNVIGFGRERVAEDDGLIVMAPFLHVGARMLGRAGSTVTQNPMPALSGVAFGTQGNPRPIRTGDRYDGPSVARSRGRR